MPFLLGTDEAGYGPNLGPLVIGASLWHVPASLTKRDLYEVLADCVTSAPAAGDDGAGRLPIADSKALYQSHGGLAGLERGLFPLLGLIARRPGGWCEAWRMLAERQAEHVAGLPWNADFDHPLPVDLPNDELPRLASAAEKLQSCGVRLVAIRCRPVFPQEFNDGCTTHGNKASLLSHVTLELAAELLAECDEPTVVLCDKHGGRNKYAAILQHFFPDELIEVQRESLAESTYACGPRGRRIEFSFRAGGERWLPTAVASMAAKYLRELAMLAWNAFWRRHLPELRPTAGYPGDAARFHREIRAKQAELGFADESLWRSR